MRTVHEFSQRVTFVKEGLPDVRLMEFQVHLDDVAESESRIVNIRKYLWSNMFVFFDQHIILDAAKSFVKFEHFRCPYFGFGVEIVSQDLSMVGLVADALSNHLSQYFAARIYVYSAEADDNVLLLRSQQYNTKQMRQVKLFDFQDGTVRGHNVLTDRRDLPQYIYLEPTMVFNVDALYHPLDNSVRSFGMGPYYIKHLINQVGAIDGQAIINEDAAR